MSDYIAEHFNEMVDDLCQLIQIPSVFDGSDPMHPYGEANTKALETMLALAKRQGFKTVNLDNRVGYIEYGEGQDYVAVLTHLDVVPEGNGWTRAPFGGQLIDGKIYGRGALDDKGAAVMAYYALQALKAEGFKPKHRIRLIMGLNEENGSKCMEHYVACEPQPIAGFTPDGEFPVIFAEKGILGLKLTKVFQPSLKDGGLKLVEVTGGIASNMVPDSCRALLKGSQEVGHIIEAFNATYGQVMTLTQLEDGIELMAKGKGAHASMPEKGINAIGHMMLCLNCLDLEIGDAANFVRGLSRRIGLETDGASLGLKCEDTVSGPLTLNLGVIRLNEKEASADINIRYPVTRVEEQLYTAAYQEVLQFEGWEAKTSSHKMPLYKDENSPLITQLMQVYKKHTGHEAAKPLAIGGGTYARSIENTVAFGILLPHMADVMHQADEYIETRDMVKITNILKDAIQVLSESE